MKVRLKEWKITTKSFLSHNFRHCYFSDVGQINRVINECAMIFCKLGIFPLPLFHTKNYKPFYSLDYDMLFTSFLDSVDVSPG